MIRVEITRTPAYWEKESFQGELERYTPPHLFLLPRVCFAGLQLFLGEKTEKCPSAFVYVSRYINKKNERVCRLERLGFSLPDREDQLKIIREIPDVATRIFGPLDILEAEVFSEVKSPIFFPSTLYMLGGCNKDECLSLYQAAGFKTVQTTTCYELDLDFAYNKDASKKGVKIDLRPIRRDEWALYWTLWGQTDYCQDTSYPFKSLTNAMFSDFAPFPSEPPHVVSRRSLRDFFSKSLFGDDDSVLGFIQWAPNIYRLASLDGDASLSGYVRELSNVNEAKIFKFFLKSGLDTDIYGGALELALFTLKAKGIKRCQIGNFMIDDPLMKVLKARAIGKHIYSVETLQKKNL